MQERYLTAQVRNDLEKKMVFVGGPRQVGKTTLAKHILGKKKGYLSWDVPEEREQVLKREMPVSPLWVFDELHKYRRWRNYLKGLWDQYGPAQKILVTGSARLDMYRYGGDSLQGRYHYLRLHPFSVAELDVPNSNRLQDLLKLGGFPEPLVSGSEVEARRWSREYRNRLIRDEVQDLEHVRDLGQLELLMIRLPELVGSPLSVQALSEDLQVSHRAVSKWIGIFENLYAIFRVPAFGAPKIRAIKKAQKHYHFDWTLIPEQGIRFENLVASHLLKWVHFQQDTQGKDIELRYFRDIDGREVDFVITEQRKPLWLIECKWSDEPVSAGLRYLLQRFPHCSAWQVSSVGTKDYRSTEGVRVCPAVTFLQTLC